MRRPPLIVMGIQALLLFELVGAVIAMRWQPVFVVLATLALTFMPYAAGRLMNIKIPNTFFVFIVLFIFGTIYLGEAENFYERYWWWDILLHFGSALSFGVLGFLFIFTLFQGDRFAAPPWTIAILSFCFAVAIGAIWEIFEFGMDQTFGTNMQKSGLVDTMVDLIVDCAGGAIGAFMGYLYLIGRQAGGPLKLIEEFVVLNRRLYGRVRRRDRSA